MSRILKQLFSVWLLQISMVASGAPVTPGYRPQAGDEAAVWYAFERGEKLLANSPLRVRDRELQAMVESITCRLAPEYCQDFRVYITLDPEFNASMYGNGALHILSGALLRLDNEAQLAALIGHEIAHYLNRDALRQWRSAKQTGALAELLSLGISPVGDLLSGGFFAGLLPFSQAQELAADRTGLDLMIRADYDPNQAPALWSDFAAEQRAAKLGGSGLLVLSTHPGSENRGTRLRRHLQRLRFANAGDTGRARYRAAVNPWLPRLLREQLKSYQPERSRFILQRLPADSLSSGQRWYYRAEIERRIGTDESLRQAARWYRRAIEAQPPVDAFRDLGYTELRLKRVASARRALQQYLQRAPQAPDRAAVTTILERMAAQ